MENIFLYLWFLALIAIFVVYYLRAKRDFKRSLDMAFLRVMMPKKDSDLDEKRETIKDFKEMISLMEQLLASLKTIYSRKILYKILGQDLISLEYVSINNQLYFYIVVPKNYKNLVEKQINWFYPDAVIEETQEINIFEKKKYSETTHIYLTKEYAYPIKTYQKLESDPINNITNAFSKLEEDESATIQIMLKPVSDDWQDKSATISSSMMNWKKSLFTLNPIKLITWFFRLIFSDPDDNNSPLDKDGDSSALTQERAKTVDEKWDKTWYEVLIRVIVTWNDKAMLKSDIMHILWAFSQFNYPDFNGFDNTLRHSSKSLIRNYIFRYFKKPFLLFNKNQILNTEEISSLFHFPHSKYNQAPEIKWQWFKIVRAPSDVPKEWLLLWHNVHRWTKKPIFIQDEDRFRHFYVIWQTGTWKSSIMQVMARQDFVNWKWVAIIDPHWDLATDLMPFIPRERADDVIYFNPSDTWRPMWLNILESSSPEQQDLIVSDATNMMIKLFGSEIFGPRIQDYFRNACITLMDYPNGWAITDVVKLFTEESFQKERVRTLKNPIVKAWWTQTYALMWDREKKEIIPYFAAKFGQFITNSTMRNIIWQTKSSFDVFDIMQKWKILLVNLSKWELWDINSELLWLILVSKIQMSAMRRQSIPKEERTDFFLYIDEFQNYITPSIESILSEARKYRLWLVLAHQYLWQLEKSDALTKSSLNLKNAVFGNVWTVMSYKIWPDDWEFLEKYYTPTFSAQDLVNMDKFKAVMKLSVWNQPTTPFSIIPKNPYLEKWDNSLAKAYKELSRLTYWRDKAFVDKEINYRLK